MGFKATVRPMANVGLETLSRRDRAAPELPSEEPGTGDRNWKGRRRRTEEQRVVFMVVEKSSTATVQARFPPHPGGRLR